MKPLLVYHSKTGNTKKIVDVIARVLDADIETVENVNAKHFQGRSLVGFGSGIYWTTVDSRIYKLAKQLPEDCQVFMFITSGLGFKFMLHLYWNLIIGHFTKIGIKLVGQFDCRGYDQHPLLKWMAISKDHPNKADLERVKQFALKLKIFEDSK